MATPTAKLDSSKSSSSSAYSLAADSLVVVTRGAVKVHLVALEKATKKGRETKE